MGWVEQTQHKFTNEHNNFNKFRCALIAYVHYGFQVITGVQLRNLDWNRTYSTV